MSDDDEYEIPLQDQRIFGAGIKRKRVKFVPSSTPSSNVISSSTRSARSIADSYLNLVLSKTPSAASQAIDAQPSQSGLLVAQSDAPMQTCEVCSLPLTALDDAAQCSEENDSSSPKPKARPHEASLAHQVCLAHSHPPSHLDRNRKGLAVLSSYGWDPDARLGLGASGQGIQFPIKTKEKNNKLGIGVVVPKDKELAKLKKVKAVKLDAGKIRKLAEQDKMRTEKLRESFYRSDDVERYLGGG